MNWRKLLGLPEEEVDVTALLQDVKEPRAQHYIFAHRYFPALTFQMGAMVVLILGNPEISGDFLREGWEDVAQRHEIPTAEQIAPDPLEATIARVGDKLITIVQLPPPQAVTEAHFVAIVSDLPPAREDDSDEVSDALIEALRQTPLRYFTLEYGYSLDNTPRTAFCEWTKEGAHLNMGDGPEPTREAFLAFLSEQDFPPVQAGFRRGNADSL